MKKVYLVFDVAEAETEELVCVCANEWAAQRELLGYLLQGTIQPETWLETAQNCGYDSVEEFQEAVRHCPDYNEDLLMEVRAEDVID